MKEKGFIMILGGCHLLMTNVTLLLTIFTQQQRKGRQQVKILGDQIPILTIWTANGAKRVVCREFFIGNIDALLRNSCQKITKTGIVSQDLRGKHLPHNKLPQATENSIRNFILSLPAVQSHYCRKTSSKKYPDPTLNIPIIWGKFNEHCTENGLQHDCSEFISIISYFIFS